MVHFNVDRAYKSLKKNLNPPLQCFNSGLMVFHLFCSQRAWKCPKNCTSCVTPSQRCPLSCPDSNLDRRCECGQRTNWPPKLSTFMVIDYCTINIQSCMIHFCVCSNTLIKMICHSFLHNKCTINYVNICILILRNFLTQLSMHTHRVIIKNEHISGFI